MFSTRPCGREKGVRVNVPCHDLRHQVYSSAMQNQPPPLRALGLSAVDEQVYEQLLARPGVTVAEIGRSTDLAVGSVRQSVKTLLHAGLASRSAGKPAHYHPARPDVAIDALIDRKSVV